MLDCEDDLILRFFAEDLKDSSDPETLDSTGDEFDISMNKILLYRLS